jgi:hypothetical protein
MDLVLICLTKRRSYYTPRRFRLPRSNRAEALSGGSAPGNGPTARDRVTLTWFGIRGPFFGSLE